MDEDYTYALGKMTSSKQIHVYIYDEKLKSEVTNQVHPQQRC